RTSTGPWLEGAQPFTPAGPGPGAAVRPTMAACSSRMDLRIVHQQPEPSPARLVPVRHHDLCAVLRRGASSSKYALMWQWSCGGGSNNGYVDFDQIDENRAP